MPYFAVNAGYDAVPPCVRRSPAPISLQRRHTVLLLATVMGGYAIRGAYTTAIANQLTKSDGQTSLDLMHTRAVAHLRADAIDGYDQIPEIRHTLKKTAHPTSSNIPPASQPILGSVLCFSVRIGYIKYFFPFEMPWGCAGWWFTIHFSMSI